MQDFASMKILNSVFALFGSGRGREVSILGQITLFGTISEIAEVQ
jgi:hypothetical protein